MIDICIIGGGAAGMSAAICAKEQNPKAEVLILEKKGQLGKKILASGNGKCNMTNVNCPRYKETVEFFGNLGVATRADDAGRVYPYTEEARTVQSALLRRLRLLDVAVMMDTDVTLLDNKGSHFEISAGGKIFQARKVLIACGGKAGPTYGTVGDGYRLAKRLGHTVNRPIPVLTAIDVKEDTVLLSGIRAKVSVSLFEGERRIFEEAGEVQFTQSGVSGICIFNLSRFLIIPEGASFDTGFDSYSISIDFFPDQEDMEGLLKKRLELEGFDEKNLLDFLVKGPIADRIYTGAKGDISQMAKMLKDFRLSPKKARGWEFAQATKGGVSLSEIDMKTMESKLVKNLYFAGEVIDYDGPCGGYNLQNAWETGMRAGKEMANGK